ncbi:hypothetical protein H9Q71_005573 [Fusarium xylarioides]|nr:hypothetical protein H9Q71_005573 [Fusarium xylarioides]
MARRDRTRDTDLGNGEWCSEDIVVLAPWPCESQGPALDDHGPSPGTEDQDEEEDDNPLLDLEADTSAAGKGNVDDNDHVEQLESTKT